MAVNVTVVPTGNFAEQVPFGQLMAPLSLVTVPLLLRPTDSVTSDVFAVVVVVLVGVVGVVGVVFGAVVVVGVVVVELLNVAPTFKCASTSTVQLFDVPEHAPVQPVNLTPPPFEAISVVVAPLG